MRVSTLLLCPLIGLATLLTSCDRPGLHAANPSVSTTRISYPVQRLSDPLHEAVAGPVDPDLRVGAIFLDGGNQHVCTGAVVHSARGNLVMTAAHCLARASQIAFAPGFGGDAPPTDPVSYTHLSLPGMGSNAGLCGINHT